MYLRVLTSVPLAMQGGKSIYKVGRKFKTRVLVGLTHCLKTVYIHTEQGVAIAFFEF